MKNLAFIILCIAMASNVLAQEKIKKEPDVFMIVEDMPKYPGGEEALRDDIAKLVKYPAEAKEKGLQGKVYITFIVNEQGKIEQSKVARGIDPLLDKEALRVLNELDKTWQAGKQKGKAVKVSYTVPINFALDGGPKTPAPVKHPTGKGENELFFIVEDMPEFPGGDKALREYIANSVKYPEEAVKNKIEGKVFVTFVVEKDGSVGETKIARGVAPSLDKEALRVIQALPKWQSGKQRGEAVRVCYTVPINFALN